MPMRVRKTLVAGCWIWEHWASESQVAERLYWSNRWMDHCLGLAGDVGDVGDVRELLGIEAGGLLADDW